MKNYQFAHAIRNYGYMFEGIRQIDVVRIWGKFYVLAFNA